MNDMTILLFEDDNDDANALFAELEKRPSARSLTLIWFRSDFFPREGREICPVEVRLDDRPKVIKFDGSPLPDGGLIWWAEDFAAAILDIYKETRAQPVGHRYARWLEYVGYLRPVALVSGRDKDRTFNLVNLRKFHKHNPSWASDAIEHVLGTSANADELFHVNWRGRNPKTSLQRFYELCEQGTGPELGDWSCMCFGKDRTVANHIFQNLKFWPFRGQTLVPREELHAKLLWAAETYGKRPRIIWIDCDEIAREEPDGTEIRRRVVTDDHVIELEKALKALSAIKEADEPMICLFLADGNDLKKNDRLLFKLNGAFVNRSEFLEGPGLWAGRAVDTLGTAFQNFLRTAEREGRNRTALLVEPQLIELDGKQQKEKDDKGRTIYIQQDEWTEPILDAGYKVIENLLLPFVLARSSARLAGPRSSSKHAIKSERALSTSGAKSKRNPKGEGYSKTLAKWANTQEAQHLNASFHSVKTAILEQLVWAKRLTRKQTDLYSN